MNSVPKIYVAINCPVCGEPCDAECHYDSNGVMVEEYIVCDHCGYFSNKCYGASSKGIDIGSDNLFKSIKKHLIYLKHRKRLMEMGVSPDPRTWRDSYDSN